MATTGIDISTSELQSTAQKIKATNENLMKRLEDIKTQMNSLSNSWESDAAKTIVQNFNALYKRTDDYKNVIESYWKFLELTAKQYEEVETALNNNANAFK
ncbi:pore-forming ESAT-6 family protein [Paenibacillus xylaniclasticus]|uniref:pore-forming ESAT-6 family protein n=1 Tax=Paenibacillus xylaniclasticus TaxID=588083 RepID=UPI000FD6BE75|nr:MULTISPECIES: pore-forming ESAT-6 family protein [Paenibacillus]GFN30951.1 hypothetical protein PCURB6_12110 [Paenibacillus curdlanolyticus]